MKEPSVLSLKEAAQALGVDKKSVRKWLINGQLSGQRKSMGMREKWFVHRDAVKHLIAERGTQQAEPQGDNPMDLPEAQEPRSAPGDSVEHQEWTRSSARSWYPKDRGRLEAIVEQLMKPLVERVALQAAALAEKDRIIDEQGAQLRLLPDLEKRAQEERALAEVNAHESEALRKQILALQNELNTLKQQQMNAAIPWWKRWFSIDQDA